MKLKSKIVYVLMLLYAIYIAIMYDGAFPFLFLFFLILLPITGLAVALYLRHGVEFEMKTDIPVISKGQEIALRMEIRNRSYLPVPFIRFILLIEGSDHPPKNKTRIKMNGMVDSGSKEILTYQMCPSGCGKFRLQIKEIIIFDYLCLARVRLKVGKELCITVLPPLHHMDVRVSGKTAGLMLDGEEFSKVRSGEDPSELFDVREYRPGDKPQKIHWKMTARTGELMVKEFSQPLGNKVVLFLDLSIPVGRHMKNRVMDSFFEVSFSLSHALILGQCSHYVVWFDRMEGEIRRKNIKSEEDVYQMLDELFQLVPFTENDSAIRIYEETYGKQSYCTGICLDCELNLQIGEQEKIKIPEDRIEGTLLGMLLEI